jgi:hypothetical protein
MLLATVLFLVLIFFFTLVILAVQVENNLNGLAKILNDLRKRHPEDECFHTIKPRPGDQPEVVRFTVRNWANNSFDIKIDGSRVEVVRTPRHECGKTE